MNRSNAFAVFSIIATLSVQAAANAELPERRWYVSGAAGGGWPSTPDLSSGGEPFRLELSDAPAFALAAGFTARRNLSGRPLRVEAELVKAEHDIDAYTGTAIVVDRRSSMSVTALMVNADVNFENSTAVTPYLGAGVGLGIVDFDTVSSSESDDSVWMAQLRAGLSFQPESFDRASWFLSYRYLAAENTLHGFGRLKGYRLNALQFGFRYAF